MVVLPILHLGHAALRLPAVEVTTFDRRLGALLDDMTDTMRAAPGVGLAVNQIGRPERACVIEIDGRHWELINPRLERCSGNQEDLEGCLSVTGYYGPLGRFASVVVTGQDRRGRPIRVAGDGLLARALQHETDHLDGRLYVDRMSSLDDLVPSPGRGSAVGETLVEVHGPSQRYRSPAPNS